MIRNGTTDHWFCSKVSLLGGNYRTGVMKASEGMVSCRALAGVWRVLQLSSQVSIK